MMRYMSDAHLRRALYSGDYKNAVDVLYEGIFPSVRRYVQQNSGTVPDAEDIFQDGLLVLVNQLQQPGFTFTATVKTYVFAVCRNLWLKRLRERSRLCCTDDAELQTLADEDAHAFAHPQLTAEESLMIWLNQIPLHCRQLLHTIFFLREPTETVMRLFGYRNKHSADNQKYKCLQKVRAVAVE